jgi:hypothetical protein
MVNTSDLMSPRQGEVIWEAGGRRFIPVVWRIWHATSADEYWRIIIYSNVLRVRSNAGVSWVAKDPIEIIVKDGTEGFTDYQTMVREGSIAVVHYLYGYGKDTYFTPYCGIVNEGETMIAGFLELINVKGIECPSPIEFASMYALIKNKGYPTYIHDLLAILKKLYGVEP